MELQFYVMNVEGIEMKKNRVCDYELDWNSGLFSCCMDEVMNNNDVATEGMELTCDSCGATMVLRRTGGALMWQAK